MSTLRSSLPSRLRQLFSSDGAIGPSVKLDSEPVCDCFFLLFFRPLFVKYVFVVLHRFVGFCVADY